MRVHESAPPPPCQHEEVDGEVVAPPDRRPPPRVVLPVTRAVVTLPVVPDGVPLGGRRARRKVGTWGDEGESRGGRDRPEQESDVGTPGTPESALRPQKGKVCVRSFTLSED